MSYPPRELIRDSHLIAWICASLLFSLYSIYVLLTKGMQEFTIVVIPVGIMLLLLLYSIAKDYSEVT